MSKRISISPEKCVGCRMCSVSCSIKHHKEAGIIKSRIWVQHFGEESNYIPFTCSQCDEAYCVEACPSEAIIIDPVTKVKRINEDDCTGCEMCKEACPLSAITFLPETNIAIKCDECDGDPTCCKICPSEALRYV